MYVRWVIRRHKNTTKANVTFHDAYLVESYRDQRNMPRQRTVCYLGNVRQIEDAFPPMERELFFLRAERILESTTDVSAAERQHILGLLRQKVPELSPDEVAIAFQTNLQWFYRWWEEQGSTPSREELLRYLEDAAKPMDTV